MVRRGRQIKGLGNWAKGLAQRSGTILKLNALGPAGQKLIRGYKKGGKVKKTGLALLHKGEQVLTKKQKAQLKRKRIAIAAERVLG